jgi:transcriptional regulator with XRE-family HTH domain
MYSMQIYEKLKVMRILKGWSQEELAEKLGYSINGYARIERGETDINLTKLEKIAKTMGVDLQQLLGLNEGNVFNLAENCNPTHLAQCNILLTETQCVHELEKAHLLLQERDKEISYLKEENNRLQQIIDLLKKNSLVGSV